MKIPYFKTYGKELKKLFKGHYIAINACIRKVD